MSPVVTARRPGDRISISPTSVSGPWSVCMAPRKETQSWHWEATPIGSVA